MNEPRSLPSWCDLLTTLEHKKRWLGQLDAADEARYTDLIEVVHKMWAADPQTLTPSLFTLAHRVHSPGAAKALRGDRYSPTRRKVIELIEMYPRDSIPPTSDLSERFASPALPLALSETDDPTEIELLVKCSRFKRPDGSRTPDDILFCTNAIEALSTINSARAQEALFTALATSNNDTISDAVRQALLRNCSEQTRNRCSELLSLSKRQAIRKLARMDGQSWFAALVNSLIQTSRYNRFFVDARTLCNR
jgi:hypothetical protein